MNERSVAPKGLNLHRAVLDFFSAYVPCRLGQGVGGGCVY
jgi:hypothetical protein